MTFSQTLVIAWIQFAIANAALLWVALAAIRCLTEPAERARLVPLALASALAVPLISALAPWPLWNLGWIEVPNAALGGRPGVNVPLASTSVGNALTSVDIRRPVSSAMPPTNDTPDGGRDNAQGDEGVVAESAAWAGWSSWAIAAGAIIAAHSVAAIYFLVSWCIGRWQLARLRHAASPATPYVLNHWQSLTAARGHKVRLLVSSQVDAPLVFGWRRPIVVVPERIVAGDAVSLRFCLAHEWSHIDRGDLKAWAFVCACRYVLWYQPAYWSLARELRICQEFLADDRSAAVDDRRLEYSELLLTLAKNRLAAPVTGALNLLDQPSQLGRRVQMLIEGTSLAARCRRSVAWGALVLGLFAASVLGMVRLEAALAEAEAEPQTPKADRAHPSITAYKEAERRNSQPGSLPAPLNYTGVIVERTTEKPIAGATVTVRRSDNSDTRDKPVEESKHTTDNEGKFSFVIPSEQVAIPRLYIELDVEHADYAARKGFGYALSMIRKNETLGDPPFFAKTELSPADPVTGTVLSPDGQPLAGVKIQGFSRARLNDFNDSSFVDTLTAADGTFRLPLVKEGFAAMWVIPKDFAIVQRYLGKTRGDLGEFKLEPGILTQGQLLDATGKPVPNLAVNMHLARSKDDDEFNRLAVFTSVRRSALTDAEGHFSYGPLPEGDYELRVEDHLSDPLERNRKRYPLNEVYMPQKVSLKAAAEPLRIQAVPHIIFEAQYYNSKGEKTNGHGPTLFGKMDGNYWHATGRPEDGHIVIKVPHGLEDVQLNLSTNEHSSLRYRIKKGDPLNGDREPIQLGTLTDDLEGVEIVRYVAPIVLVKAVDENGNAVRPFKVAAAYAWGKQRYVLQGETRSDLTFEKQPDGQMRSEQMLPDEEITFTAMADGYESASEKLSLPEGEQKELAITLKKKNAAAEATQPATKPADEPKQE